MKILALESSAVSASVALTDGEKLIAQSFQNCGLTHSRTLLPMAESLLANCGIPLSEIDAFAVANGPGSFTGVRIVWQRSRGWPSAQTGRASVYPRLRRWPGAPARSAAGCAASWTHAPGRSTTPCLTSRIIRRSACAATVH